MTSGQFNPVSGDEDLVWRLMVPINGEDYYAVVDKIHGSTTGAGWLTVFEGSQYHVIHRVRTQVSTAATVFGHDSTSDSAWESEVVMAAMNSAYRKIDSAAF